LKVEGRFSTRLLVESGWKLSKGKENRLKRNYHTITKIGQANGGRLTEFLSRNGQALLCPWWI